MSINSKKTILEFKNVCFGYEPKKQILNNISFSIKENEHVCIVGPNGSGKSTLGKIILALLKPTHGNIYIFGKQLSRDNVMDIKKKLGAVFENPDTQFVCQTVEDEIAFGLENIQVKREEIEHKIFSIAKKLNIHDLLSKNPSLLSGGQKQKVAIAACLVSNPEIIVFDEASNMLDPFDKKELNDLIVLLKTKFHKTIISITHDMSETLDADKIILLSNGSIIKESKPLDFFTKDSKIESYGLSTPLVVKIANELGLKASTNLDKLVKEIVYGK